MNAVWTRVGVLYVPMVAALLGGAVNGRRPRQFVSVLLGLMWVLATLVVVQRLNLVAGWWSYANGDVMFCGMPLELYLGWAVLWAVVPQMVFPMVGIGWCAVLLLVFDLAAMPLCGAVVTLGPRWRMGEAVAVLVCLVSGLWIARWTFEERHLSERAWMQVMLSGMLFLFLLPEVVFALRPGRGWGPLLEMSGWARQVWLQVVFAIAVPGVSAVMEFVERGGGTPIPFDPPRRLVTSGVYRYCANPMQTSCALVMLVWAGLLRNGWMLAGVGVAIVFSAGIAAWDEGLDLERRFGAEWKRYRAEVGNWRPRWRPYSAGARGRVYIAASCGPCSELSAWLETRRPVGLEIVDAECLPAGSIRRMKYEAVDGSYGVDGVRALARALEHLHLGWAVAGAFLRLPVVWQFVQVVMDASGLGPRVLGDVA
jgi:protein-S-isoprenylcysteine O-methyltransferase Ste14